MISLAQLNALDRAGFVAAIGHVFEHTPWLADATWERRPFQSVEHLHAELCRTLRQASRTQQLALIQEHPDLAGRLAQENRLTVQSTQEQASAGLDRLTSEELAAFQALNHAYRERFSIPFIICARLNQKSAIVEAMRRRLEQSPEDEFRTALDEIEKIARLRLLDSVSE